MKSKMRKKILMPIIGGVAIVFLSASTIIRSSGIADWSGSPVDGGLTGGTCYNSGSCHQGGVSGVPTLALTSSPAFGGSGSNLTYVAGTTYTVTVTKGGSYAAYGFNCEFINSQSATTTSVADFGTWGVAVTSNCQIFPASGNGGWPTCASHNQRSTTPWSFTWTAPASGTGYIYADVLGVDNSGSTGGDQVSAVTSITLTKASNAGIASHAENTHALAVFPNPATDNVRITYTLMERGTVSIKLYNINGALVTDLVNETQDVGMQNSYAHLPAGLANGLYMVKLSVNGEQSTQKLVIQN
ncbi:MAG: T9SS type A sorting domain-containing protein [Bacteroidia bacterium]